MDDSSHYTDVVIDPRALRTRARWKKIRAATLVFILFRRRLNHGGGRRPTKRTASTLFFSKQSSQAATVVAASLFAARPTPELAASATKKLELFERLTRKPIQNRTDVDMKLLAEFIRHTTFFEGLTSASIDALAMQLRFRTCHEGEVLHRQGSSIDDSCSRYLVVSGSLLVYRNAQYAHFAREGEDYIKWYLANNPSATIDSVKYGECVDIRSTSDTCGDDAISGHLFREQTVIAQEKTVIAHVTQADYKRVIRFNVEKESLVFEAVKEILTPAKPTRQELRQAKPNDPVPTPELKLTPQQTRTLLRFLGRYACFRILPFQYCTELIRKLQLATVRSDDVVCTAADAKQSMIMVLKGRLCVHVQDTYESQRITLLERQREEDQYFHSPRKHKPTAPKDAAPGCDAGPITSAALGAESLHLCTLTGGDSFGELAISTDDSHLQGATIYHPVPAPGQPQTAVVVRLPRQDYAVVLQRYLDVVDLNLGSVRALLTKWSPQDRTDEQLFYIKNYLLRRSSARMFFAQLPSRILDGLVLHSHVEVHRVDNDSQDFIQKEYTPLECMRIVLHGYVGLFKGVNSVPTTSSAALTPAVMQPDPAMKKAVLRRYQSRLVRANTRVLDTSTARASGHRASVSRPILTEPPVETGPLEPLSILPPGATFGHLQILTGQPLSAYAYAAFASAFGGTPGDDGDLTTGVVLLTVPARFVHAYLAVIDEQLIYNPVRTLKRLQHGYAALQRTGESTSSLIRGLRLAHMMAQGSALRGIPQVVAKQMLEDMAIASVEPHRVIYERGDIIRETIFVVLSGSVRIFQYAPKPKARRGSVHPSDDEKRPKLPRRVSQEIDSDATTEKLAKAAADGPKYAFEKPAGDSIFLSDYSTTMELGPGDWFGRHGAIATRYKHGRRPSTSTSPRRSTHAVQAPATYAEHAVTMSECLIGVVTRKYPSTCELSVQERECLVRMVKERNELDVDASGSPSRSSFSSLGSSFKVLEAMGLAHRLSTEQRVNVAHSLKHWKLAPGETVYRQGETSSSIFFVVVGSVAIILRTSTDSAKDTKAPSVSEADLPLLDVIEGEVFGDEAFVDSHTSTRQTTAVASVSNPLGAELLYLTRDDYDRIVDEAGSNLLKVGRQNAESKKANGLLQILGLGQRTVTAKDRWKMAVYQMIQRRAKRSQWPTVLTKDRDRRIDLLVDLVKALPIFDGVPIASVRGFCANGVLQTFCQDTTLFTKGDTSADFCFLVVHGSITLYQTHYSTAVVSMATVNGLLTRTTSQSDNSGVRIPIQSIRAGGICGEFESLEDHGRRHISAVTAEAGTKLVVIQQEDFFALWPRREQLEQKLSLLKSQIRKVCCLDPDHLCALYYATRESSFRRNDVLSGNEEQAGTLHVILEGTCVVHDSVVLKKKNTNLLATTDLGPRQLALDTRVSTLGPGALLFADCKDKVTSEPLMRRASARALEPTVDEHVPPADPKPSQYVIADSPTVRTLSVQLFPRRTSHAQQRLQELFVEFLLGKTGLQAIRETVDLQLSWRATNVQHAGRLAVHSLSQGNDSTYTSIRPVDPPSSVQRSHVTLKTAVTHDLARVLIGRPVDHDKSPSLRRSDQTAFALALSPRVRNMEFKSAHGDGSVGVMGSFGLGSHKSPSARPVPLPSLTSPAEVPRVPFASPRHGNWASASPKPSATEQLRLEEQVLHTVAKPPRRQEFVLTEQQQKMRRRHGRPPPKAVENNSKFVDEHTFSTVVGLRDEHERRKSGLCRRLLHVKSTDS